MLRSIHAVCAFSLVAGLLLTDARGQEVGLTVGSKAPGFELTDQHGKLVSLEALTKQGNVAIVFYRSADW